MVTPESIVIRPAHRLDHTEAARIAEVVGVSKARTVILDMRRVVEATTPGLARLVIARRELLHCKRDIRIAGLNGQPARLLEVHRLQEVLPVIHHFPHEVFIDKPARDRSTVAIDRRPLTAPAGISPCLTGFEQICYA